MLYSFLFGLLHGILPDEHTWPITFSYAIGGASGREGLKAGLSFSGAFTIQRMLLSELSYLALTPILRSPGINGVVYLVVGCAMSIAGAVVLRRNQYLHLHLFGRHHSQIQGMEEIPRVLAGEQINESSKAVSPPIGWTLVHGFIAGFGVGGFSLFINTVAAPAMPNAWLGFMPGLLFGLGTMIMLALIGAFFGAALRRSRSLTEEEIKRIGAQTGGRTLFFGGLLFGAAGISTLLGLDRHLPLDQGYMLIGLFMLLIAIPAFVYSLKEVLSAKKKIDPSGEDLSMGKGLTDQRRAR
jgi:hypothetical protein